MSIGWFVDARRARRRRRPRRRRAAGSRDARRSRDACDVPGSWDRRRGVGVQHASSMTSTPASSRIASAFSVASRLGSPAQMKGTNAHWLASSGQRRSRRWTRWPWQCRRRRAPAARAVRRLATAERVASLTPARGRRRRRWRPSWFKRGRSARLRSRGGTRTTGACVGGRHLRCRAGVRTRVLPSAAVSASAARRLTRFRLPPPLDESRLDKSKIVMIVRPGLKRIAIARVRPVRLT